ncbi:MAG: NAD(P)H-dependent oxidoreductase [Bdellovibrionaceae bacterium]|nr:NAD(P)H-dependent oxidoreductase [Pseudobdellovibrionaceae bacterium]MBX3032609.1 NAD(P)H-dependent oxidoreductase [Pseudobdellovibrionaceae bacterium]
MILIISGTDRDKSNTRKVAGYVHSLFEKHGEEAEILDLAELKPTSHGGPHYGVAAPDALAAALEKVNKADGLYMCIPEYNGSMPGALKYFVDHWKYPESFEFRPVAFCGLGGMWGGLRPVEHMQGVMGYRNSFMYPERIFVREVFKHFKDSDVPNDSILVDLFEKQVTGFIAFIKGLKAVKIDANSRRR